MSAPRRGGGGSSRTARIAASGMWPSIALGALLGPWLAPAPGAAQQPTNLPPTSGANAANPVQGPAITSPSPAAGPMQVPGSSARGAGAGSSLDSGLPALPGAPGVGAESPADTTPMSGYPSTGPMQAPPIPLPMRTEALQPPGPLPLASVVPLPAVTLDHYGDGAGTTGAGLIWLGQLPDQYGITRYQDGDGRVGGPIPLRARITPHNTTVNTQGTLSYGPPGLHPGFNGFGLSLFPGYGYGGNGLGTGALGGYPCYGGPGYSLHYGYPKFAYPYYEGIGQLYYDQPVVIAELVDAGDFGPYTGASAYAYTHPSYASQAAATGSFVPGNVSFPDTSATNPAPNATFTPGERAPDAVNRAPLQNRFLGMDVGPGSAAGRRGMSISSIIPGSTAANAGLQIGDIILSINGQPTEQLPQMAAIIDNAAPGSLLRMTVLKATDGSVQDLTIRNP